jgi:hypothetical protein
MDFKIKEVIFLSSILHNGFLSSINIDADSIDETFDPASDLDIWYETSEINEEIEFDQRLNYLLIFTNSADLYIEVSLYIEDDASETSQIIYIPSGSSQEISMFGIESIRVLGAAGQFLRWYGLWL